MKSPFRYPGGKSRKVKEILPLLPSMGSRFVEPFCGGASVALAVAEKHPRVEIWLNDLDPWVSAFWQVVVGDSGAFEALLEAVDCIPTVEQFMEMRIAPPKGLVSEAFYALFFNRTAFSGILTSGPIGGLEQKGDYTVGCRYNAKRLLETIRGIRSLLRGRCHVTADTAFSVLAKVSSSDCIYLDPPYFVKGGDLYRQQFSLADHVCLANTLRGVERWLLSYDDVSEIRSLYEWACMRRAQYEYSISGKGRDSWETKVELYISKGWVEEDSVFDLLE